MHVFSSFVISSFVDVVVSFFRSLVLYLWFEGVMYFFVSLCISSLVIALVVSSVRYLFLFLCYVSMYLFTA